MSAVDEYHRSSFVVTFSPDAHERDVAEVLEAVKALKVVTDAAIAELEAEVDNLTAKGTPGWLRLRELERERDEANTGAIAQRRAFEKTLEKRDKLIAEIEASLSAIRKVYDSRGELITELERDNRNLNGLNDTLREAVAEAEADLEALRAERDEAWEREPNWAVYSSNLRKARDRADEAESEQYRYRHLYEAERRIRRADDKRMVALTAKLAALKARLRWLFDNFAEVASPTEDFDEWCAEIDTHITDQDARP